MTGEKIQFDVRIVDYGSAKAVTFNSTEFTTKILSKKAKPEFIVACFH